MRGLFGLWLVLVVVPVVHAETPNPWKERCGAALEAGFLSVQDAPTRVVSAKTVEPSGDTPAQCVIDGYVAPQVGFELKLPESWNGKLMAVGNSGWGGGINGASCDRHLRRGYACVASDTGHKGAGVDGLWATNNLPAQIDFGYRSVHVMTLAAKAIVSWFYQKDPAKSYFMGCSTGGYEGMVEAQRFPWDFDGIIAGSPDMDEADLTMRELWGSRSFLSDAGQPLLDAQHVKLLHKAVLAECDKDDGVSDGIIGNPVECHFNPSKLLCKAGARDNCLTAEQVEAARRIYAGPPIPGERTQIRGSLPGSELNWEALPFLGPKLGEGLFRYMIYGASPEWTPANYDFNRDYKRLGMGALYTDTNPDLRKFRAAGGKLLVYQGWNDVVEMPTAIVDYYETVERTMGGLGPTQGFFRLFMVPGMNHCGGGDGASGIDYVHYLEAWVEKSEPPNWLLGGHVRDDYVAALPPGSDRPVPDLFHPDGGDPNIPVAFTRPIYPYPLRAKYKGTGDPNDASNFVPSE